MAKYTLGKKGFSSKDEIRRYCQQLLKVKHRLPKEDRDVVAALIRWHPKAKEKYGSGIRHIDVIKHPGNPETCFQIVRTDGSAERFSYRDCLKPRSPYASRKEAFRVAIKDQMIEAKMALQSKMRYPEGFWIDVEKRWIQQDETALDHYPIPFAAILDDFLKTFGIDLDSVEIIKDAKTDKLMLKDQVLTSQWLDFHQRQARYRLTSREYNSRMGAHGWKRTA